MKSLIELRDNLHLFLTGLSLRETRILERIQRRFLNQVNNKSWSIMTGDNIQVYFFERSQEFLLFSATLASHRTTPQNLT